MNILKPLNFTLKMARMVGFIAVTELLQEERFILTHSCRGFSSAGSFAFGLRCGRASWRRGCGRVKPLISWQPGSMGEVGTRCALQRHAPETSFLPPPSFCHLPS
jgi:hypothetical protein